MTPQEMEEVANQYAKIFLLPGIVHNINENGATDEIVHIITIALSKVLTAITVRHNELDPESSQFIFNELIKTLRSSVESVRSNPFSGN